LGALPGLQNFGLSDLSGLRCLLWRGILGLQKRRRASLAAALQNDPEEDLSKSGLLRCMEVILFPATYMGKKIRR
jgi:hypothetical protein